MARPLFDSISLGAVDIGGTTLPCIYIIPMRKPGHIAPEDYYLVERYELSKSNPVLMANLADAITYQKVLYYMSENIYMCSYLYMDGYDLGVEPTWIDIKDTFRDGDDQYIDTTADPANNYYVYRLVYCHDGVEVASEYVMGLQESSFSDEWESIADQLPEDLVAIRTSLGAGHLYRESRTGIMMMKGFPLGLMNPRYRGPIESAKENVRRYSKEVALEALEAKMDAIEAYLSDSYGELLTDGSGLAHRIRTA